MKFISIGGKGRAGKDEVARVLRDVLGLTVIAIADPMKRLLFRLFDMGHDQLWGDSPKRDVPDERYVVTGHVPNRAWIDAWLRLDSVGPDWVRDIGLRPDAMISLRWWFLNRLHEACGIPPLDRVACTPRHLLQTLGTGWGRSICESLWTDYLRRTVGLLGWGGRQYDPTEGVYTPRGEPRPDVTGVVVPDVRYVDEARALRRLGKVVLVERPGAGIDGASAEHPSEGGLPPGEYDAVIPNVGSIQQLRWLAGNVASYLVEGRLQKDAGDPPDAPGASV